MKNAVPQDFTFIGAPIIINGLMSLYGRTKAADWIMMPANVTISNTPGPMYRSTVQGHGFPRSTPSRFRPMAWQLNLTVQSYCDQLDFGVTGDKKALPDIDALAEDLVVAMNEIKGRCTCC